MQSKSQIGLISNVSPRFLREATRGLLLEAMQMTGGRASPASFLVGEAVVLLGWVCAWMILPPYCLTRSSNSFFDFLTGLVDSVMM